MEFTTKVLNVDSTLQAEIAKLAEEGWQLIPGCQPKAVYQLCREPNGGRSAIVIDESKVHIVKAGQPFPKDGGT